jgi:hypothetical protein
VNYRILLSCLAAGLFAGCGETITQYRSDSAGRFRKIATTTVPRLGDVTYLINGAAFGYRFRAIGHADVRESTVGNLAPGQHKVPFVELRDGPFLGVGKTSFGGVIRRLKRSNLTTDQLISEARPGGEAQHMFFPEAKPSATQFREINGNRWLVTTKFDDGEKKLVQSRVWWMVVDGFLVTLYVNMSGVPSDPAWRQRRVDQLERLVADFHYVPAKG